MTTIIVSPTARETASRIAPTMPGKAAGPSGDARTQFYGVPADRSTTLGDIGVTKSDYFVKQAEAAQGKPLHEEL